MPDRRDDYSLLALAALALLAGPFLYALVVLLSRWLDPGGR